MKKVAIIITIVAFLSLTLFYFQYMDKKKMEANLIDTVKNLENELDIAKVKFDSNIDNILNQNVISDVDNEEFHAVSKLFEVDLGDTVWINVELKNNNIPRNIEIIKDINSKMIGLSTQEIEYLMIDYSCDDSKIVNFMFDLTNLDRKPLIMWENEEYKSTF